MNTQAQPIGYTKKGSPIYKKRELRENRVEKFFAQFKVGSSWFFVTPRKKEYGHDTIEACQEQIVQLEKMEMDMFSSTGEWRIKEELV